jgi:coenzyme F420-0:L-glutamate ligase/coenzyme F420-1:gamma-L-glutamate ligase
VIQVWAPDGVPEIAAGDDLASLVWSASTARPLVSGDVVVVTSKAVSKSEGRVVTAPREEAIAAETVRVVARRGPLAIVRNRNGLTLAAAGVDASNVETGSVVLLPLDPDASARRLRSALAGRGVDVAVIVTDTLGRPWREGQTDVAIGAAGLLPLESFAGQFDAHGNELAVTAPAVADEIAGAAELAQTKLGGRPFAIVRGLARHVLPPDVDGPGAAALVRPEGGDLFGFGAREAVVRALAGAADDMAIFGSPASEAEVAQAVRIAFDIDAEQVEHGLVVPDVGEALVRVLAYAHGWTLVRVDDRGPMIRPTAP